jgi:hypothetical protein
MDGRHPTEHGKIVNDNMASQIDIVGQNAVVADNAVVSHVHVGHQQAVVTDSGLKVGCGTPVEGAVLSDNGVFPDGNGRILSPEFEVLRYGPDYGTGKNFTALSQAGTIHYGHVGFDYAVVAYFYIALYHAKWSYLNILADFGFGVDYTELIFGHPFFS